MPTRSCLGPAAAWALKARPRLCRWGAPCSWQQDRGERPIADLCMPARQAVPCKTRVTVLRVLSLHARLRDRVRLRPLSAGSSHWLAAAGGMNMKRQKREAEGGALALLLQAADALDLPTAPQQLRRAASPAACR